MTNEQNFKKGDRVRHVGFNLCGIITDFLGERFVKVKAIDDEVFSTWDINNLELCDRRTAFLRRLGALLREYDARIDCQYHEYAQSDYPCVIFKDKEPLFWLGNDGITADNIMDFDKE